jgi:hypothetical protein
MPGAESTTFAFAVFAAGLLVAYPRAIAWLNIMTSMRRKLLRVVAPTGSVRNQLSICACDRRDFLPVERLSETREARSQILDVSLARAVRFLCGNKLWNQFCRRDAAFARFQLCDEKVGGVCQRLAVRAQTLDTFCGFLAQPRTKLGTCGAILSQLGILERGKGVRLLACLEEGTLAFSILAMVNHEL